MEAAALRMPSRAEQIADEAEAFYSDPAPKSKVFIPGLAPRNNNIGFNYSSVEEAFPEVDARMAPMGSLILVMVRQPLLRTQGGIKMDPETRKTEQDNTQAAKVIAVGPLAFSRRDTGQTWPEGAWCQPGDYVRIPKYQGDHFVRSYQRTDYEIDETTGRRRDFPVSDEVRFVMLKDLSLLGKYPDAESALADRAFI